MRARRAWILAVPLSLLALSCARRVALDRSSLSDIHRLAVVVRVYGGPTVDLPTDKLPPQQTADKLARRLRSAVSDFELGERVRAAITQHLPDLPPFTDLAPAVQVDSALGDLLTVERPAPRPDFAELKRIGVDGVLYVELSDWGVSTEDAPAYFLTGTGRMFTLDGDSTVWRAPVAERGPQGGLPAKWADPYQLRAHLGELATHAGTQIALDLGGSPQARSFTPDLPEIQDDAHPPEKVEKALPFAYEFPDAGAPDAGGRQAKPVSAVPDGGDPLFPF